MHPTLRTTLHASAVLLCLACALPAQGMFVNYEDPQVKPIAVVATLGSDDYVLACNTPDNSVEIYRAEWNLQAPIARVPVGLSPVTVKWDATSGCFYTCNYLGDSVSRVKLTLVTTTTPQTVDPELQQTEYVGNEPTDIAFLGNGTALVTLHAQGLHTQIQLSNLAVVTPGLPVPAGLSAAAMANIASYGVPVGSPATSTPIWVAKQPRRIEVTSVGAFVLNTMGGEISSTSMYDCGLFANMPGTGPVAVSGVGTTNFGFAINAANTRMYVVSQIGKNVGNNGVAMVAAEPTGFVQTWLQVVTLSTGAPVLEAEQALGTPSPTQKSINLNRDYSASTGQKILPSSERIAQATDVILIPDVPSGGPERIVVAGFGSERVAVLTESTAPGGYSRMFVNIPPIVPANSYSAVGPRGLAWSARASETIGHVTPGLVFVMNRLDNSLAVMSPWTGNVTRRALANDPTPANIRAGRKFLYTAAATSGNEVVSCSSCHIDARTDGLRWRLGDNALTGLAIAPHLKDGYNEVLLPSPTTDMPANKPALVTQTLQGLVNHHLEPDSMQFLATNAPYHWRGDKATFQEFNEAFFNLQGKTPNLGSGPGSAAAGVTVAEMDAYASFINTIHHPPNPEQFAERTYEGTQGAVGNAFDPAWSGALLGRAIYHLVPVVEGRSCANCHSLPDGSSNTLTEAVNVPNALSSTVPSGGTAKNHPMETAALRNVVAREALVPMANQASGATGGFPVVLINGTTGLHHGGIGSVPAVTGHTLNDNMWVTFKIIGGLTSAMAAGLTDFVRQLDTGTAPLIGDAWTITNPPTTAQINRLQRAIRQADEANVGIAAFLRDSTGERGFWYDVRGLVFRQENGSASMSATSLVAAPVASTDVLILQVTPAGSERRVASLTGTAVQLTGAAPSGVRLLAMVPGTAYEGITAFEGNIDPSHPTLPFVWNPNTLLGTLPAPPTPISQKAQRALATAVLSSFGMPAQMRHEPPRRLRVAGSNIRNGAKLGLEIPDPTLPGQIVWFDLSPTALTSGSVEVWETAEELDAMQTLALLCGGPWDPAVAQVLAGTVPPTATLNPTANNNYIVHVRNEDSTQGSSGVTPLTIADVR